MRSTKEADAVHSGMPAAREGRPADAKETPVRQRLTLRHLHSLIEALREEHLKLEMRVDRLSDLVDRMAAPDDGERREPALVGYRVGESRPAALPELPDGRDAVFGRGAAQQAAAEERAAFGFAIWAGVERAIGNAAVMLAAERDTDAGNADRPAGGTEAPLQTAALFRRQRPPEHGQHEVPVESLLLELREAARIADEIAANASAEHRADPAHPPRAPDMSGGDAAAGPGPGAPASPAADMPAITIPRSERHRARKKRSLWARLFRRQQAWT